ncbi:hypothetical protein, partial [Liquorilactobacillus nagelii]|uniref:hypothetical protein n=1 Tax=Liquorilactobacillus nagelii TaxID=82688 RepID=UPI0039E92FF7
HYKILGYLCIDRHLSYRLQKKSRDKTEFYIKKLTGNGVHFQQKHFGIAYGDLTLCVAIMALPHQRR